MCNCIVIFILFDYGRRSYTYSDSKEFFRIRIGIGSPPIIEKDKKFNTISHVLGNFSKPEKLILNKIFCQMIESLQKLNDHNENAIICELNSFNINET